MAEDSELNRLDPEPVTCKLSTGFAVEVVRLRTRQFFRLLRILTHGAAPQLLQSGLDFSDPEGFTQRLLVLILMSIPDAEQEAIGFLQSMCQPAGLVTGKAKLSKQEQEDNDAAWEKFNTEMFNPAPEDTFDLIEAIVRREAPELQALGKKAMAMLKVAGVLKDTKAEEEPTPQEMAESSSPASSPSPSTSSPATTGGPTSTSSTSPSAGSASAPRRSRAGASASSATG